MKRIISIIILAAYTFSNLCIDIYANNDILYEKNHFIFEDFSEYNGEDLSNSSAWRPGKGSATYSLYEYGGTNKALKCVNNSDTFCGLKGKYMPSGNLGLEISKEEFELSDNAVLVYTCDVFIHDISKIIGSGMYAMLSADYGSKSKFVSALPMYTQYHKKPNSLEDTYGEIFAPVTNTGKAVWDGGNSTDFISFYATDNGKWVNLKSVIKYDKNKKEYNTVFFVDGTPIVNKQTGKVSKITVPTSDEEIASRKGFYMYLDFRSKFGSDANDFVAFDNVGLYRYSTSEFDEENIEVTHNDDFVIKIPVKNGFKFSDDSPDKIKNGHVDLSTVNDKNIKVYSANSDITKFCDLGESKSDLIKIIVPNEYASNKISITVDGVEDIAGNILKVLEKSFEWYTNKYNNEYWYEDFSNYNGEDLSIEKDGYYIPINAVGTYSLYNGGKHGNVLKVSNNTSYFKAFDGPRSDDNKKNFEISYDDFENSENPVLVYSYDLFIHNESEKQGSGAFSYIKANNKNYNLISIISASPMYTRYWKRADSSTNSYHQIFAPVNNNDNVVWDGGNTTDFLTFYNDKNGKWVKMISVVRYDKQASRYITTFFADGVPIKSVLSGELSTINKSISESDAKSRTQIGISFNTRMGEGSTANDWFGVDNLALRKYGNTLLEKNGETLNVSEDTSTLKIPLMNNFEYTPQSVPSDVKNGFINTETVTKNTVSVKSNGINITEQCNVYADCNNIFVELPQKIENKYISVCVDGVCDILGNSVSGNVDFVGGSMVCDGSVTLLSDSMFYVFERGTAKFTLNWENEVVCEKNINVSVLNYNDETVFSKNYISSSNAEKQVIAMPNLDLGHYRLTASINGVTASAEFSVVNRLSERRESNGQVGFCTMAIRAWDDYRVENFNEYAKSLALSGVKYTREYMNLYLIYSEWKDKTSGSKWLDRCEKLLDAYAENGIDVSFMIGDSAEYPTELCTKSGHIVPDDLENVYQFFKYFSSRFAGKIDTIEIFNEIDSLNFKGVKDGADQYASFFKAAALGIKDSGSGIKVSNFAFDGTSAWYRREFLENDIKNYIDVYNYHTYTRYKNNKRNYFSGYVSDYILQAERYGLDSKQKMLSEFGLEVDVSGREDVDLTWKEQKEQARYAIMASAESIAQGTDKTLWFIHDNFVQRQEFNFSTFDSERHSYPIYSAFSAFINNIGRCNYRGKLAENTQSYVFGNGAENVILLAKENGETIDVHTDVKTAVFSDMFGNEKEISAQDGVFSLSSDYDVAYLRVNGDIKNIIVDAPAERKTYEPAQPNEAEHIIMRAEFSEEAENDAYRNGYRLKKDEQNNVILHIYNFNSDEKTVNVFADISGGWMVKDNFKTVVVPSMSSVAVPIAVDGSKDVSSGVKSILRFGGYVNGIATSECICYVSYISNNETEYIPAKKLIGNYQDPLSWTKNVYLGASNEISSESENSVRFSYEFPDNSIWSFPYLDIPENFSFEGTDGIILNVKSDKKVEGLKFGIYLNDGDGEVFASFQPITFYDNEQQVLFEWEKFYMSRTTPEVDRKIDLSNITKMRIGFYGTSSEKSFCVSYGDIGLLDFGAQSSENNKLFLKKSSYINNNELNVNISVENYSDVEKNGIIIIAQMKNDVLKRSDMFDFLAKQNSSFEINKSVALASQAEEIKIFTWKDIKSLTPISQKYTTGVQ